MAARLAHFSINADDVDDARRFYSAVFGWRFRPWGPPGFFHIDTGAGEDGGQVVGALQARRELIPGTPMVGLECTFGVDDVDATAALVVESGGRMVMERMTITGVGHLNWFSDPAGNVVGAMQYDAAAE